MNRLVIALIGMVLLVSVSPVAAQSSDTPFRVGGQVASVSSGEFDTADNDNGFGALFSWVPMRWVGFDAEVNFFPENIDEVMTFSPSRLEGLFGVTIGPQFDRLRPFAKVRPGFLDYAAVSGGFACIAIYPPPLSCVLAGGKTTFALDLGGGFEYFPSRATFIRVDGSDRMLRYPAPVFDMDRQVRQDPFFAHDFRLSVGGGFRF
jgi:hypothetical protein